jgi:hypothetical protein
MARKKFSFFVSMEILGSDLRQTWRQILKAPAFTTTVVFGLAVGFGVCIAIFSIVRHVLLTPLPYKDADRLIQIVSRWPKSGDQNDSPRCVTPSIGSPPFRHFRMLPCITTACSI